MEWKGTLPMSKPTSGRIRLSAEEAYAQELSALVAADKLPRPANWRLSPKAVVTYILGGKAADGTPISAKYVGNRRLIETAVATLATDRALLLLGLPGTAKSCIGASGGGHFGILATHDSVHGRHR